MTSGCAAASLVHKYIIKMQHLQKRLHISMVYMGLFIAVLYDREPREWFLYGAGM